MRQALILSLVLPLVVGTASCGFDRSGLGDLTDLGGGPSGDADSPGGDAASPGGGDPYPTGAITFFKRASCPSGWETYEPAVGRTVVPTLGETPPGTKNGEALTNGEDRRHAHKWNAAFAISKYEIVAFGGDNDGVAGGGNVAVGGTTDPASSGVPYVQLLVCKKLGAQGKKPLPAGMQVYFDAGKCPSGFRQTDETQGRVLVGLPKGAGADQPFGAKSVWGSGPNVHTHALTATLQTSPHGLAVASGCCNDGFASNGKYEVSATTEPAAAALPWVELVGCTKE